ncbi:MAG: hypothetical protein ACRDTH_29620 [Pseudonocardiaceae bacterium]
MLDPDEYERVMRVSQDPVDFDEPTLHYREAMALGLRMQNTEADTM